jgi:hypothetical protein
VATVRLCSEVIAYHVERIKRRRLSHCVVFGVVISGSRLKIVSALGSRNYMEQLVCGIAAQQPQLVPARPFVRERSSRRE